jgi:hypothetical protein
MEFKLSLIQKAAHQKKCPSYFKTPTIKSTGNNSRETIPLVPKPYIGYCLPPIESKQRRSAGAVERDGLENRCGGNPTQGSNPCSSANKFFLNILRVYLCFLPTKSTKKNPNIFKS